MDALNVTASKGGLRVVAYPGDNKILLAMSLDAAPTGQAGDNLAGFAIWRTPKGKPEEVLPNRISFTYGVSKDTTADTREWTPSDQAPFQKFRWIDVPPDGFTDAITYRVRALYFAGNGQALAPAGADPHEVTVTVNPARVHNCFQPAFTRGYIASQAYTDKFKNADIRPSGPKTADFSTAPFQAQYRWLGADAREALFAFLKDCETDTKALVNVFAYDLDEPDVIASICRMGKEGRLRAILDNAPLHTASGAVEITAAKMIIAAAGADHVRQGHFDRFQHNKVFIKRDASGSAQRVLFGSMNFSVRGLYVQANNVIVVDDANTAGMFARAFDAAFVDDVKASPFRQNDISAAYMVCSADSTPQLPKFSLALSPHIDWSVSLGPMAARIRAATSSVLFAVMAPTGGGPVLASLREIAAKPTVFSYGTVETDHGLAVQNPNGAMGAITGFAALIKNVPANFQKEFSGGMGMHIHSKYVVVDFNGANPTVFTGSSNLASGGETQNGDSLAMIEDEAVANMYAVEAVATFDHYHFRKVMQTGTKSQPITLWFPGKTGAAAPWWQPYYDKTSIQFRDRCLFAQVALPPDLQSTKQVDWTAVDAEAPSTSTRPATHNTPAVKNKPATTKKAAAKKKPVAKKKAAKKKSAKKKTAKKKATKKR